jgi:hypothetical protein
VSIKVFGLAAAVLFPVYLALFVALFWSAPPEPDFIYSVATGMALVGALSFGVAAFAVLELVRRERSP